MYQIIEYNLSTGHREVVGRSEDPEAFERWAAFDSESDHVYLSEIETEESVS